MDRVSKEKRSAMMGSVRGRDTRLEVRVRRLLHRLGYRFRLHRLDLPGKPDIVLPKWRAVILIHGCFWHQHEGCAKAARPTSNVDFWKKKLDRNVERDAENLRELREAGWRVLVVWECEAASDEALEAKLRGFLAGLG